jgi:hypothetical protein
MKGMTVKITITADPELSRTRFLNRVRAIARRGRAGAEGAIVEQPGRDRDDLAARRADPLALDPYSPIG